MFDAAAGGEADSVATDGVAAGFMNCRISVILLASLLAAGCASRSTPTTAPADVAATYAAPADATGPLRIEGVDYDYIATPSREQQILEGFPKLRVGQSREEVRA